MTQGELADIRRRGKRFDDVEAAARALFAPDLDAQGKRYTIASDDPDFVALRDALEGLDPDD